MNPMRQPRWYRVALGLLLLAYLAAWGLTIHSYVVARSAGTSPLPPVMTQDSSEYAALAHSLLSGEGFTLGGGAGPEYFRAPGYPAFLAGALAFAGGSDAGFFLATVAQIGLVFLAAGLIVGIGERYFSARAGRIASLLFLANPYILALSVTVWSDILFTFLLLLGIYLLLCRPPERLWRTALLCGIVFAAACYVRPVGLFALPIFFAPLAAVALPLRKKILSGLVLVACVVLLMLPWMWRNYASSGSFTFTSLMSFNLAWYNAPLFEAHERGTSADAERQAAAQATGVPEAQWKNPAFAGALERYSERELFSQPFSYALYHLTSTRPFITDSDLGSALYTYGSLSGNAQAYFAGSGTRWWRLAEECLLLLLGLCALLGLWKGRARRVTWVCAGIVLYLMLLAGPVANARYRVPVDPYIALLAASGAVAFAQLAPRTKLWT